MTGDINPYQVVMIGALIGSICFHAGQAWYQNRQNTRAEARHAEQLKQSEQKFTDQTDKWVARFDALTEQVSESRRENGVIIGCLYVLSGAIKNEEIKDIIENMLRRDRVK
jgi:hypothetical protein